jgi:hypothetical protein
MILPPFTDAAGLELVFAGRFAVAVAIVVSRPQGIAKNAGFYQQNIRRAMNEN